MLAGNGVLSSIGSRSRCSNVVELGLEVASRRHAFFDQPDAAFHLNFGQTPLTATLLSAKKRASRS